MLSIKRIAISVGFSFALVSVSFSHDAWLAAQRSVDSSRILIVPLVGEAFPQGEPIREHSRFTDITAWSLGRGAIHAATSVPADSLAIRSLSFPLRSLTATAGVKPREIDMEAEIMEGYLSEEIGLAKDEIEKFIQPGITSFHETYRRYLKLVAVPKKNGSGSIQDTVVGLPIEIVLDSVRTGKEDRRVISLRLLKNGLPVKGAKIRCVDSSRTQFVRSDEAGKAEVTIVAQGPALFAYIELTQLSPGKLSSVWANCSLYEVK